MNSRRALLALGGLTLLSALAPRARAHSNAGRVLPAAAPPETRLTLQDGKAAKLHALLRGRVTALQLVFTRCRATCPIQGALYGSVQRGLSELPDAQLLSISIDPAGDDAEALRGWLARHEAGARWRAARPEPHDLDALMDFLKARAEGADRHTAQVYYFDRKGRLTLRSVDFPPATEVVRALGELHAG